MAETKAEAKAEERDDLPTLVVFGGHTHRSLFRPLSEHFKMAFLSSGAYREAYDIGVDGLALENYLDGEKAGYAANEGLWQSSKVMDRIIEGSFSLDGQHPHLKTPVLAKWLPGFVYEQISAALARVMSMAELKAERGIAGILVHEDVTPEGRIMAQFGQSENIPVIHIPHANHFIDPSGGDIHGQIFSDYILAAGEWMAEWYVRAGADPTSVELVGAPQWDWLYQDEKMPSREHARRALGLDPDGLVICYCTTWQQETNVWGSGQEDLDAALAVVLDAAKGMGAELVIKMHPGDVQGRESLYRDAMWSFGVHGCITRGHNEHALRASDCAVVQGSSTIGVPAGILGVPIVEMWQCGTRYPRRFGIPGTWGAGLEELIERAITKGPNREFIRAMNYDDDGGAVGRIVEWLASRLS